MPDVFTDAISKLVTDCPGVSGAAFTDLDGEEIAIHPRARREELRLCAAYGGIALRRLNAAEERSGRAGVRTLILHGTDGSLLTLKVGDQYQLVVSVARDTAPARVVAAARAAVETLEENL
jgi:predicted regulator of Ras-like GTPase activity (Roadblock/LC7/MglB family)